ncbi:hypothetical protein FOPG_19264 [Fusarium oxysporum f. sp. conglutinans race 2 54008]|uniref:Uncharacterized protein n=1 Tax=Fusarium oxysporum f. sp. conglutinans race 2 54008 TaxID=1089457 RepID=X0GLJ3_FUSOX|nr:hypothetical protein FOPG_19264 [Fusarium oxysporum f. sp. conglutinans race 2 54008]KAI8398602.1 hypothetical protein FOFC_19817 [Fusarium oxysporum]
MTHVEPLFELQSSAPGMPGPYLVENLASYRVLDKIGQKKSRMMLVLGGARKRQHISSAYSVYGYPKEHSVGIADVGDNTLALDGELHLQKNYHLPRFQEKRPFGGGCHGHILEQGFPREGSIAHQIYANVLSPLSDIILIFVPDFGLQNAIELLCSWMESAMGAGFHIASRVVLLHDSIPADLEIKNRLLASFASKLRKSDPLRSYTSADTQSIIKNAFHITSVSLDDCTWRAQVEAELNAARACRMQEGMDFTAHQVKYLLRRAIRQYAQDPLSPLDIIRSLKQQHAPDSNYSDAIRDFLQIHQPISDMEASIVASALNLDAHPPGTPWFPPERIFQSLYQGLIEDCNFFVITAFLEGWDLSDCFYHLKHLRRMRLRHNSAKFGKNLSWDLNKTQLYNNKTVLLDFGKKSLFYQGQSAINESQVSIQYSNSPYTQQALDHVAYSLIASLFYIKLHPLPTFYKSEELCTIKVYCRIPAGPLLLNLVYKLYRSNTLLCSSESQVRSRKEALCGDMDIELCQGGYSFERQITVKISSPSDVIDLSLENMRGSWPISKCPYQIEDLIRDQSLDCPTNPHDTLPFDGSSQTWADAETELGQFLNTLRAL